MNEIVLQGLVTARVPSRLEPIGVLRSDGRRQDGATLVYWKRSKTLVWDATCHDTYAPSHRSLAAHAAGEVAKKRRRKRSTPTCFILTIDTSGNLDPKTMSFIRELEVGKRLQFQSGEQKATSYLIQRLSMGIQRGNAASILEGKVTSPPTLML